MQKILNFVKGAVSTKDLVPVLTNFHFYDGRVQGGNGRITIDAPLDLGGVDITVPAVPFLRAVDACDGAPVLNVTPGGKLTMKKGGFKSLLPLSDQDAFPRVDVDLTEGTLWKPELGFIKALRTIRPLIGDDASRPWSCGALFKDGYIYATNNVVMVRIPWAMPDGICINIPRFAVEELIRVGEEPAGFMFTKTSAVFVYGNLAEGTRWIKTQLFESAWPDVDKFFTDAILLDAFHPEKYGGTGLTFDWNIIGHIGKRVFLAGGINPDNATSAIELGVYGIDVCSGVRPDVVGLERFYECQLLGVLRGILYSMRSKSQSPFQEVIVLILTAA